MNKMSNNQRSQKQIIFSRVFSRDFNQNDPVKRQLQRKMERLQMMSGGGIFKKNNIMKRGSNI